VFETSEVGVVPDLRGGAATVVVRVGVILPADELVEVIAGEEPFGVFGLLLLGVVARLFVVDDLVRDVFKADELFGVVARELLAVLTGVFARL